jgi:hypothetical protein
MSLAQMLRSREANGRMSKFKFKLLLCMSCQDYRKTKSNLINFIRAESGDLKRVSQIGDTLGYKQIFGNEPLATLIQCSSRNRKQQQTIVLVTGNNHVDVYVGSSCYKNREPGGTKILLLACTARVYEESSGKFFTCDNLTRLVITLSKNRATIEAAGRQDQTVTASSIVILKGRNDFVL